LKITFKFPVTKKIQKVFWVFVFGHFFLSIFENPKKVSKKGCKIRVCDDNAAETEKVAKKSVTINFFIFFWKTTWKHFVSYI
jgi:hypothetical protein